MSDVLIFGEILFDRFPGGETVLGGAPMNVAWHLNALGVPVTLVSRVGNDRLGEQALQVLARAGLDVSEIQHDDRYPTGTVDVQLEQGSPRFDIINHVAYDYIEAPKPSVFMRPFSLLYHGTLALRNPVSHQTLASMRTNITCPIFVDVNLRAPYWEKDDVNMLITAATWVKINHEELALLSNADGSSQRSKLIEQAAQFYAHNHLQALIVTCGAEGAFIVTEKQVFDMPPVVPETFIDTVGAGDAFSAMTITGLMRGWDYQYLLEQASGFAARICGIRGAIPPDDFVYPEPKLKN